MAAPQATGCRSDWTSRRSFQRGSVAGEAFGELFDGFPRRDLGSYLGAAFERSGLVSWALGFAPTLQLRKRRSDRVKCVDFHPSEPWTLSALYSGGDRYYDMEASRIGKGRLFDGASKGSNDMPTCCGVPGFGEHPYAMAILV